MEEDVVAEEDVVVAEGEDVAEAAAAEDVEEVIFASQNTEFFHNKFFDGKIVQRGS